MQIFVDIFCCFNYYSYLCNANRSQWAHISNNSHGHTNSPIDSILINLTKSKEDNL